MGKVNLFNEKLLHELEVLREECPDLRQDLSDGGISLTGKIRFSLEDPTTRKPAITDEYSVEISIPSDFPATIPIVREIDGKIKRSYEHVSQSGILCLGIPSELELLLKKHPTIKGFIKHIVTPNLFAYSFYKRYGFMPWPERPAGRNGIYLRYVELFQTADARTVLALLRIVLDGDYKGNCQCPCGSTKTLNECHGQDVYSLWQIPFNYLMSDYYALKDFEFNIDTAGVMYKKY